MNKLRGMYSMNMKRITVLINSMTDGGAEMVLSRISKNILFSKVILLEKVRKFELYNQNCETLRDNYRFK